MEFIDVTNTGGYLARMAWRCSTLRLPWYVQEGGRSPTLFTTTGTVCGCCKAGFMQPLVCWHRGLSALLLASWHMLSGWLVWFGKCHNDCIHDQKEHISARQVVTALIQQKSRMCHCDEEVAMRLLTRYAKLRVAHVPGMPGTFSPSPTCEETAR